MSTLLKNNKWIISALLQTVRFLWGYPHCATAQHAKISDPLPKKVVFWAISLSQVSQKIVRLSKKIFLKSLENSLFSKDSLKIFNMADDVSQTQYPLAKLFRWNSSNLASYILFGTIRIYFDVMQ